MAQEDRPDIHYSDWLTLLGFMGEDEALGYVKGQGKKEGMNEQEWIPKIRNAISVVNNINGRRQTQPEIRNLPQKYSQRIEKLQNDPTFKEHQIGVKSLKFGLVELAKLHCFQIHLNMEYVDSLVRDAPDPDDLDGTVKFCLPTRDEKQKTEVITAFNQNTNTFSVITDNLDLRILGTAQGEDGQTGRSIAGFAYGFGLPQLSVVNYNGLFMIKNGYHRAYALLRKGHDFMPCIVVQTDSFQGTGGQTPGFFSIDLLNSDKSPILSDFSTGAAVLVPRRRVRLMATVHAEVHVVPV